MGPVQAVGQGTDPVVLGVDYTTIVYDYDDKGDARFLLTDIPLDDLIDGTAREGQLLHVVLLWQPKAGRTPMNPAATNASIRHVVLSGGQVGVYGGAGFVINRKKLGRTKVPIDIEDSTLRLLTSTDGFQDPLTPVKITGSFTAEQDPKKTQRLQRAMSQYVTNAIGRRTYVRGDVTEIAGELLASLR